MKKRYWLSIFGFLSVVASSVFAQSALGTWQVDLAQSNFGSDEKPLSLTMIVTEDTPKTFAYRFRRVTRGDNSPFTGMWSGPKDGSARRVTIDGYPKLIAAEGMKEVNGVLIFHGIEEDGSLEYSRVTISHDRKTMTAENTWTHYDGSQQKEKWVFHRAQNRKKQ